MDETGNMIAAAYLSEYPGRLGVLMGPWVAPDIKASVSTLSDAYEVELLDDSGVQVVKLLLQVATHWGVELVQTLSHRDLSNSYAKPAIMDTTAFEQQGLREMRIVASGMQRLTLLSHLVLKLDESNRNLCGEILNKFEADASNWRRFRQQDLCLWLNWLDGTYIDTMDCPELNGIRSTAMTLEGYWSMTGAPHEHSQTVEGKLASFDSDSEFVTSAAANKELYKELNIEWWGLCTSAESKEFMAGVMLSQTSLGQWELTYMGVHHKYRGKGLGRLCLAKAILRCKELGGVGLSLAVDVRNKDCMKLYSSFGFKQVSEIEAWIFAPPKVA